MRVNVYAEELTNRIKVVRHEKGGKKFVGVRVYLELPVTLFPPDAPEGRQLKGPYYGPDDCSAAFTLWGEEGTNTLHDILTEMINELAEG